MSTKNLANEWPYGYWLENLCTFLKYTGFACVTLSSNIRSPVILNLRSFSMLHKYWPVILFALQLCVGQNSCSVTVAPEMFGGDPCPSVMKKLSVEAICSWWFSKSESHFLFFHACIISVNFWVREYSIHVSQLQPFVGFSPWWSCTKQNTAHHGWKHKDLVNMIVSKLYVHTSHHFDWFPACYTKVERVQMHIETTQMESMCKFFFIVWGWKFLASSKFKVSFLCNLLGAINNFKFYQIVF